MKNKLEGQKIPQSSFKVLENGQLVDIHTDELFKHKKVILFALPGAFTPTCSSTHVPRFNQLAPHFKTQGIDHILCLSVNDAFVMDAWKKSQKANDVQFLPDGNGSFTEQIGMLEDKTDLGFGKRSWRYSMYVENGIIKKVFSEEHIPGDPFKVSDADTMYHFLYPKQSTPKRVSIFTKAGCPHCKKSKDLLEKMGYNYDEIEVGEAISLDGFKAITGEQTVPQVYVDGERIGGADSLALYFENK